MATITTATSTPTTVYQDVSVGANAWNVGVSPLATLTTPTSPFTSHYLVGTNLGFAVPTSATILGITVTLNGVTNSGSFSDTAMRIVRSEIWALAGRATLMARTAASEVVMMVFIFSYSSIGFLVRPGSAQPAKRREHDFGEHNEQGQHDDLG